MISVFKLYVLFIVLILAVSGLGVSNVVSASSSCLKCVDPSEVATWDHVAVRGGCVGNAGTHVFHSSGCSYVNKIKHKVYFKSRDEAVRNGYKPCGHCHP